MEFAITVVVLAVLVIVAAAGLSRKLGVAAPLLLVLVGIGVSLVPAVPAIEVDPEWILVVVLPPLLYSASVSLPAMNFRREFTAIGGFSVVLVVVSAVLIGLLLTLLIPGLPLSWGIALGAVVSPTDAVATSIVKQLGVSPRVVAMLEGESLLNDATALVLLRTAVAATAASVSVGGVVGDFAWAVGAALVLGFVVGRLNLWVRSRIHDATVSTVVSLVAPFVAAVPAEELGASGLVAAVVAGLVTGRGAARVLPPRHRLADAQNWRTAEFVLEGAVFLVMGLELFALVTDVQSDEDRGVPGALGVAAVLLVATLVIRAAYVAPQLWLSGRRANRGARMRPQIDQWQERLADPDTADATMQQFGRPGRRPPQRRVERTQTRLRRLTADIDYYLAQPLGWREGGIVVWAGMRGAVTLAAAQTLPEDAPSRSFLVLVAFLVATGSLLLQGGTLPFVVRALTPPAESRHDDTDDRAQILTMMREVADSCGPGEGGQHRLTVLRAQRQMLLDARDDGVFDAETLSGALVVIDAEEIGLELRGEG